MLPSPPPLPASPPRLLSALRGARRWGRAGLSLLYPPFCAHCQEPTGAGQHLCRACRRSAPRVLAPFCQQCSEPFSGAITGQFLCANCQETRFHFRFAVAPYRARGVVREFILRFKYERHFYLRHELAHWLARGLRDSRLQEHQPEALVPVPLHAARYREREFNQAEELARLLSRRCGLPVEPALERARFTITQTRLDRAERMENLRGAFRVPQSARVQGRRLLLIDDVLTTGSTVEECARMLCQAGAASVSVLTVARA